MPVSFLSRAVVRGLGSLVAGLTAGAALLAVTLLPHIALLTAISVAAALFAVTGLAVLWPMDADRTRDFAYREDFKPFVDEVIVVVATLGGLAGILVVLVLGNQGSDDGAAILALLAAFGTWACLHTMYAARYAYIYYRDPSRKVIDFNTDEPPTYQDFFYFSFAVGMTYGITDTAVSDREVRVIVLRHSIISYVFGAAIIATAINLVVDAISI
ncbi:DUF1345 domain-containing protein [Rothia sp. AR01]|uniref:DUF1345 domain-containing protein n=1 Tax=Rothia santali TaxID=2949643 RepID=A0A9X2HGU3_9MICC|nr:DUF1345 domain-containing protein [Rothia santali]MCP3424593.1 DUF1345 domain-containing protein [Rothia santali]